MWHSNQCATSFGLVFVTRVATLIQMFSVVKNIDFNNTVPNNMLVELPWFYEGTRSACWFSRAFFGIVLFATIFLICVWSTSDHQCQRFCTWATSLNVCTNVGPIYRWMHGVYTALLAKSNFNVTPLTYWYLVGIKEMRVFVHTKHYLGQQYLPS